MTSLFFPKTPSAKHADPYVDQDGMSKIRKTDSQDTVASQSDAFAANVRRLEGRVTDITFEDRKRRTPSPAKYNEAARKATASSSAVMNTHAGHNSFPSNISPYSSALLSSGSSSMQLARECRIADVEPVVFPDLQQKPLTLDEVALHLEKLESLYREAKQEHNVDKSQTIKKSIDHLRSIADQMNHSAGFITRRDLQIIESFFSPPLEQFHTDPATGRTYFLADNSQLVRLATIAWTASNCYSGIEVSKLYTVRDCSKIQAHSQEGNFNNLCDIIFFQKIEEQFPRIAAITGAVSDKFSWLKSQFTAEPAPKEEDKRQTLLDQQNEVLSRAHQHLQTTYKSWGYSGFCILQTEEQLLSLNLSASSAKKYQAICLFLNSISAAEQ